MNPHPHYPDLVIGLTDNARRASTGALLTGMQIVAADGGDMSVRDNIGDAITNLMHLAHARNMDIESLMRDCMAHFLVESNPGNHEGAIALKPGARRFYPVEVVDNELFKALRLFSPQPTKVELRTLQLDDIEHLLQICSGVVVDDYFADVTWLDGDLFLSLSWEDSEGHTFESAYRREDNPTVQVHGASLWLRREKEAGQEEGDLDMLTLLEHMRITAHKK